MREFLKRLTDFSARRRARRKFKVIVWESQKLCTLLKINDEILSEQPLPKLLDIIIKLGVNFLQADAGTFTL